VLDAVDGGTVGVRVPGLSAVRDLLTAYGEPLHATSANIAGEPAPRTLEDVDERILEAVDVVVAGEPGSGEASAVVDLSAGKARLLRSAGELTEDRLRRLAEYTPSSGEV
jgi:L-threonylcarbamoyladenylate synthase